MNSNLIRIIVQSVPVIGGDPFSLHLYEVTHLIPRGGRGEFTCLGHFRVGGV